ncbi:hypothetical protein PPSIR1_01617 [Plesiocystis pacifica SIR-1]|uniref:Uncharacterized protein n=1 Tax=Plesiocystis pacifica SIR-1 TaxID=391625 RepID=A6G8H4_9BACT|nr:hypothetical protein [Plesiocystis pacifica]EDM77884.1 hypothetical protein PPSIR1_01617 [Plesiocystis pacifica SIR-1]
MRTLTTALLLTLIPSIAWAHEGHAAGSGWSHHALEIGVAMIIITAFAFAFTPARQAIGQRKDA